MPKKDFTLTSKILMALLMAGETFSIFFPSPVELKRRRTLFGQSFKSKKQFENTLNYLIRKGWVRLEDKNLKRFIKLTKKGQLEALLAKARLPESMGQKWDGKWRLIIFDIPEGTREKRDHFRRLLKQMGFKLLQASVFVSPYPLNKEAVKYLNDSGLIDYIRILKVEEMDDDSKLKKLFGLK